jgi:hypothetical protein
MKHLRSEYQANAELAATAAARSATTSRQARPALNRTQRRMCDALIGSLAGATLQERAA